MEIKSISKIHSCFKCNEKEGIEAKLRRKDVRHRLQEIFGKEFIPFQWKQAIKCKRAWFSTQISSGKIFSDDCIPLIFALSEISLQMKSV